MVELKWNISFLINPIHNDKMSKIWIAERLHRIRKLNALGFMNWFLGTSALHFSVLIEVQGKCLTFISNLILNNINILFEKIQWSLSFSYHQNNLSMSISSKTYSMGWQSKMKKWNITQWRWSAVSSVIVSLHGQMTIPVNGAYCYINVILIPQSFSMEWAYRMS